MTFEELYIKAVGDGTRRAFAEESGLTEREWCYVVAGERRLTVTVWRAMLRARPDMREEINDWFLKNVINA